MTDFHYQFPDSPPSFYTSSDNYDTPAQRFFESHVQRFFDKYGCKYEQQYITISF